MLFILTLDSKVNKMSIKNYFAVILTLTYFQVQAVDKGPYCGLPCGKKQNVVCERSSCAKSQYRCKSAKAFLPSAADIETILDAHNSLRNKLATGDDKTGGNSEASNMMVLSYDKELEFTAICTSNTCTFEHTCSRTPSYSSVGQNIFMKSSSRGPPSFSKEIRTAIGSWYGEIKHTNADLIKKFKVPPGPQIGHFTQVVWAKTKYVGCGGTTFGKQLMIVCNYAPAGNFLNQPVYTQGKACGSCPGGLSCNSKYKGLCGEISNKLSYKAPQNAFATRLTSFTCTIFVLLIFIFLLIK